MGNDQVHVGRFLDHGRRARRAGAPVVVAAAVLTLLGCSAASSTGSPTGSPTAPDSVDASTGPLTISGAFVPQPPSPDVAAVYFTVHNAGATPDTLSKVSSDVTSRVMPMTETSNGTTGEMTSLSAVVVPAHGDYRFERGKAHLMLEDPVTTLRQGGRVRLTLTFAKAGAVTFWVPVTDFAGPPGPGSTMSGMSGTEHR